MLTIMFLLIRHVDLGLAENGIDFYTLGRNGMLTFVTKVEA